MRWGNDSSTGDRIGAVFLRKIERANRERDDDPFRREGADQRLDELVPYQKEIGVRAHPQDDPEVDARIAERLVADRRLESRHPARDRLHDLARDPTGDALDVVEVTGRVHGDRDEDQGVG